MPSERIRVGGHSASFVNVRDVSHAAAATPHGHTTTANQAFCLAFTGVDCFKADAGFSPVACNILIQAKCDAIIYQSLARHQVWQALGNCPAGAREQAPSNANYTNRPRQLEVAPSQAIDPKSTSARPPFLAEPNKRLLDAWLSKVDIPLVAPGPEGFCHCLDVRCWPGRMATHQVGPDSPVDRT